jgi:DNA-binding MarR family transcriptional regulator
MVTPETSRPLTESDRKLMTELLLLERASPYVLAKNTGMSYATMYTSAKKLESLGLVRKLQEVESKKRGRKIIYVLTDEGRAIQSGKHPSVVLNRAAIESVPNPLDDLVVRFTLSQRRETAELDFKLTLNVSKDSDFAEIAKDIFAMSNYGGGHLVFGYKESKTGSFDPVGLPDDFHVDQATLQEKFNSYSNEPIVLEYIEVEKVIDGEKRKFAIVYVPPSPTVLKPIKYATYKDKTGRERKVFSRDEILIRRGTQSVHATLNEIEFIERRSKQTAYKISLLSGEPDNVLENLYTNIFKVTKLPIHVFEVEIPSNVRFSFFETRQVPYVRPYRSKKLYSFCDLNQEPFRKYIVEGSSVIHPTDDFLGSQEKKNLLIQLLNSELRSVALNRELRYDRADKNVYFYPTDEPERHVTWQGRYRKTPKQVARNIYVSELKRSLFAHDAASMSFHFIENDIYLVILPRIVLTLDGYDTIQEFREGPIKTSLSYNEFNDIYLNLVLFWISRFKSYPRQENIELEGRIVISAEPLTARLGIGIMKDRPLTEFHRRKDELYSFEMVDVE